MFVAAWYDKLKLHYCSCCFISSVFDRKEIFRKCKILSVCLDVHEFFPNVDTILLRTLSSGLSFPSPQQYCRTRIACYDNNNNNYNYNHQELQPPTPPLLPYIMQ